MGAGFWILIGVLAFIFLVIAPFAVMSGIIYFTLLVRNRPDKWGRACSAPDDPVAVAMFEEGMEWAKEHGEARHEVQITNEGYRLWGEFFDFGSKKAVIIISGRTESLLYSYYFAEPYRRAGYSVLVTDLRAHGNSDGKVNSLGFREYSDTIAWAEFISREFGVEKIVLHGICIGASNAMMAITSDRCPDCVAGIVTEGMFTTFCESFKNHMIKDGHPLFPFVQFVMLWTLIVSRADAVHDGPVKRIKKLKKPILMLQSLEDEFSKPDKAGLLFDLCPSEKKIVYFDHGEHSRIRPADREKFDETIIDFLSKM